MKFAAALVAFLTFASVQAEVTFTWKKMKDGVQVASGVTVSNSTGSRSKPMAQIAEARKRRRESAKFAPRATVSSSNWCGAALTGTGFTSVTGQWTVPVLSLRPGQTAAQDPALAQWVGIDGFSDTSLIQAGSLSELVNGVGQENIAWVEMLPGALIEVSLPVNTNNVILVQVSLLSSLEGEIILENLSLNEAISGTLSGGSAVSGLSAEWILEDFESNGALVPFAGFPTNSFSGSAVQNGVTVAPAAATLIELIQSSVLCVGSVSGSTVTVAE